MIVITPGGAGTKGLIDAKVLAALGAKGYLINLARGSVVYQPALIHAVTTSRRVAKARGNMASGTWETRGAMADLAFANLQAHFAGKPLLTPVP